MKVDIHELYRVNMYMPFVL